MSEFQKFPRTIRLDSSDMNVFPKAAESREWAVPGTFAFSNSEPGSFSGKEQLAFKSGWLGLDSFGRSTLVQVASITYKQLDEVMENLAAHFVKAYGAPSIAAALPTAQEETNYAIGLCDHPIGTLLAIDREFTEDNIAERVLVVTERQPAPHARIWEIVDEPDQEP